MPYYRKKPIPVEARQFTGDNFLELQDWSHDLVALSDYNEDVLCEILDTLPGAAPIRLATTGNWDSEPVARSGPCRAHETNDPGVEKVIVSTIKA